MNKRDLKLITMLVELVNNSTNKVSISTVLENCKLSENQRSLLYHYCDTNTKGLVEVY